MTLRELLHQSREEARLWGCLSNSAAHLSAAVRPSPQGFKEEGHSCISIEIEA
ncbi:hypothetical protein HU200_056249 [Digitaria exilis]|uniref:Uncharacterized protein n=1 Tax=Digitaria exilis TaxID=1010633 RepID=A0A835AJV3_9POAL|nr:hypothetical protein HU200_056249 [Digitaria exilis]